MTCFRPPAGPSPAPQGPRARDGRRTAADEPRCAVPGCRAVARHAIDCGLVAVPLCGAHAERVRRAAERNVSVVLPDGRRAGFAEIVDGAAPVRVTPLRRRGRVA